MSDEILREFESAYLGAKKLLERKEEIKHPLEVLSLNQYIPQLEVISLTQGKISLSLSI